MEKEQKSKQGKRNRQAGARFELKVRKDLESKGWIVSKWMNNVEFAPAKLYEDCSPEEIVEALEGIRREFPNVKDKRFKLIPAKHKFRGKGRPMVIGTGFPDFICFKETKFVTNMKLDEENNILPKYFNKLICTIIIGVEVKSNGYLTKEEKEKCYWLLTNNIFSKILIASKGKKRGEIIYKEFNNDKDKNGKRGSKNIKF